MKLHEDKALYRSGLDIGRVKNLGHSGDIFQQTNPSSAIRPEIQFGIQKAKPTDKQREVSEKTNRAAQRRKASAGFNPMFITKAVKGKDTVLDTISEYAIHRSLDNRGQPKKSHPTVRIHKSTTSKPDPNASFRPTTVNSSKQTDILKMKRGGLFLIEKPRLLKKLEEYLKQNGKMKELTTNYKDRILGYYRRAVKETRELEEEERTAELLEARRKKVEAQLRVLGKWEEGRFVEEVGKVAVRDHFDTVKKSEELGEVYRDQWSEKAYKRILGDYDAATNRHI